jgi:hypothetical protein
MVILSVDSSNNEVSYYLKNKLNYKKIVVKGVKKREAYTISLKIKIRQIDISPIASCKRIPFLYNHPYIFSFNS